MAISIDKRGLVGLFGRCSCIWLAVVTLGACEIFVLIRIWNLLRREELVEKFLLLL